MPNALPVLIALVFFAAPATAWEASRSGPVCLLSHQTNTASVQISHDPRESQPYAIQLRLLNDVWRTGPVFAMRFDGPGRMTITTDRHQLVDGDAALIVTDTGFGNVLQGLEANVVAFAILGEQVLVVPLEGAAHEVARFRACALDAGV